MTNLPNQSAPLPRDAAQQALKNYPIQAESSVQYLSQGRLLLIGPAQRLETVVHRLPESLTAYLVTTDSLPISVANQFHQHGLPMLEGISDIELTGWMGNFRAHARTSAASFSLAERFGLGDAPFDLVLDLCEPAVYPLPTAPVGYFAVGSSHKKLAEALNTLPFCAGGLTKPQYVSLDSQRCDHVHADRVTCQLCLSVCDTRAIRSQDHAITLNPYLCQGCGDCATVCPTSAFHYAYPTLENTLTRIQAMLKAYTAAGGRTPSLLLHDGTKGREWVVAHQSQLPISVLPYEIEALGSTGLELWFMALALGANQVILLDAGNLESKSQPVVQAQITVAQTLLAAMRYPMSAIRWVRPEDIASAALPIRALMTTPPIRLDCMANDKRAVLREAIDHLQQGKSVQDPVALPKHGFFGAVRVAVERCTLCMNCVDSCPESALVDSDTQHVLSFIEANCIQCQGCMTACPENAITLEPRYAFGPEVHRPRELMVKKPHPSG